MKNLILVAMLALASTAWATPPAKGPTKTSRSNASTVVMPAKTVRRAAETAPFSLPMAITPTMEEFNRFIPLDANGDGKTWKFMSAEYLKYDYNDDLDADEWLFIPFTTVSDENFLKLTVQSRVQSSSYKESFEIAWGASAEPAAMTVVMDVDNITNTQWETHDVSFAMSGSGINYLGLHANSIKGQYGLWLREISLELQNTPVPLAPILASGAIDNLEYTATVVLPSQTIQGKAIEGNVGLSIAVDGTEYADYPACNPGENKEISLTLSKGVHTITYTAYIMADGRKSFSSAIGDTVRATSGEALPLPFFMAPTLAEFEQECFVVDSNNDGNTWTYNDNSLQYSYGSDKADDWVFLPAVDFGTEGGAFDLSVDAKCASNQSPESFEICVGRTTNPAEMSTMLTCSNIKNTIWDTFTGTITVPEGGRWYVGIHCISEADQWNLNVANIAITAAPDITPGIPTVKSVDFNGTEGSVTYILPTLTAEEKPLEAPVGLIVSVDGVELPRIEPVRGGTEVTVPMTLAIGQHTITAAAFVENGETILVGSPAVSTVIAGNPEGYVYPLPFEMRPSLGEFETLTTLDANSSGINWEYNTGADNGKGAMVCRTADGKSSDAWIFFPKVAIADATRIYKVKASVRAYLERFPEDFEICIGNEATPEAMTVLVEKTGMNSFLYEEFSAEYIAPEAGSYIIGIHRKSNADAHTLSVYGVGIADSGKSANAPTAVTDLSAKAAASGELTATLSFTMPLKGISGAALDPESPLTATVTSSTGAVQTASGKPGERVSVTIAAKDGFTEFEVRVASENYGEGESARINAYCGFDKPGIPTVSSSVSDDNMSMTINWTDAATGENGGAVDVASLRHNVYVALDDSGEYWNLLDELPAGVNSYTYTSDKALQDVTFIAVAAVNDKGMSLTGLTYDVLGVPYPLPMADDFSTGRYMYTPVITPTPTEEYSGNWFLDDPGLLLPALSGKNMKALFCVNTPDETYKYARLALPKFSTASSPAASLSLSVFSAASTPAARIYARTYDSDDIPVGEIEAQSGNEWKDITFDLPASLLGKAWVNFFIEIEFGGSSEAFILKSYSVKNIFEKQLQTTLRCSDEMIVGESYTIFGSITNQSETAQTLPQMRCTLGSTELDADATIANPTIAPGVTSHFSYTFKPTADHAGTHTLRFELVDYTDQIPDDNVAETEVTITPGNRPVVLDLKGESTPDGGIVLSWSTPEIKLTGNDDIEDYEAFTYATEIGPWLNIDRDGNDVYGIGVSIPGEYEPKAFQVIDTEALPAASVIPAYSGSKYFMAVTPENGPADDWLISPEVTGGSKVSFRLNILSEEYGAESIDVLYSSTGRSPEDFILLKTFSQARIAWNPLEVTLPADARYFAFHYRCEDIFGICLDDIFYSPLTDAEITGYNIYCNGEKIADTKDTAYKYAAVKSGDRFNVAVVTTTGSESTEHPLSNTVVSLTSGAGSTLSASGSVNGEAGHVVIKGYNGQSAVIYSPDGKISAAVDCLSGYEKMTLPAGIYIIKISGENTVTKVVVH